MFHKFKLVIYMLKAILVIIGTIIGAGFASGKEIFTFFNVYGIYGILGIFLAELLIGFIIYKTFNIILKCNISRYSNFISVVITKSNFGNLVICNIVNIFLFISFVVMVAGFSAYFSQEFNLPNIFGAVIISVLAFLTFLKSIQGIVKINTYFIPFLIIIVLLLGLNNLTCFNNFEFHTTYVSFPWFISSFLYASYNLIIVIPILISLNKYVCTIKKAKMVSIGVFFFLFIMSIILFFVLNNYFFNIEDIELPTVLIATKTGIIFKYVCGFTILIAIFTTAISSGYSFLSYFNIQNRKWYIILCFLLCFISILLSNIGFSYLLNLLYPILGMLRFYPNYIYSLFLKNTLQKMHFIDISI